MNRDRPDMLHKLGMLGGGAVAVGGMIQQEATERAAREEKDTMQSRELADAVTYFKKLKIIQELKDKGEYVEPNPEDDFDDESPAAERREHNE